MGVAPPCFLGVELGVLVLSCEDFAGFLALLGVVVDLRFVSFSK